MKTYRIKVDGKVYEMTISLVSEEVYSEPESSVTVGERLSFTMETKTDEKIDESSCY